MKIKRRWKVMERRKECTGLRKGTKGDTRKEKMLKDWKIKLVKIS